jgi:lysophospholipase L1-like esterase
MKTILCYGDSNTHGADPAGGPRFDLHTRWPGVLRRELGADYWVIEEGLGGRTTVFEDGYGRNGAAILPVCLESHQPIDLVIIMLGTNDLKPRFGASSEQIAGGVGSLVDICQQSTSGSGRKPPKVLLLTPPPLAPIAGTPFEEMFAGGEEKSRQLSRWYARIAAEKGVAGLDLGPVIQSSRTDGIHLDAPEHAKLARAVAAKIRELL